MRDWSLKKEKKPISNQIQGRDMEGDTGREQKILHTDQQINVKSKIRCYTKFCNIRIQIF